MSIARVTVSVATLSMASPGVQSEGPSRETPEVRALLLAAREGDHDAFGRLVALNQSAVFRTVLAALGSRDDAEDVVQEVFVQAWRKLGSFRGDASFRTWLLAITWRKAVDARRIRRLRWRRHPQPGDGDHGLPLDQFAGPTPDPERRAAAAELADRARAEIRRLSPTLRDTLLLAASGAHTYDDIAALLGVPLGTVKWRVAEARRLVTVRLAGARHD